MRQRLIDETGHRYGSLIVLEKIRRPEDRKTLWKCLCDCGNEIICSGSDLRTNKRTSCGKHCNAIKDETGKIYGFLEVIQKDSIPAREFADNCVHWICKCKNCGEITSISGRNLRAGNTSSCGCIHSTGELNITKALQGLGYSFKKEYSFDDLVSPLSNKKLYFDFAIFDDNGNLKFLIEHQGNQHWEQIAYFGNRLEKIKACDNVKKIYCSCHNIPCLYILPVKQNKAATIENMEEIINDFWESLNEISS